jgi:hypothetical protein
MAPKVINGQIFVEPIQMQWYVIATRGEGGTALRMPFYLKPVDSQPVGDSHSETFNGSITAGDGGVQAVPDATYVDISFQVGASTYSIDGNLDYAEIIDGLFSDLDLLLLDPNGEVLDDSLNAGGPEHVSAVSVGAGVYTYRVSGYLSAPTDFTITSTQTEGVALTPTLDAITGEFVDSQGRSVDFDSSFQLQWHGTGGEQRYEIERSTNNEDWEAIANVAAGTTALAQQGLANGLYYYRVRSLFRGRIGYFVTEPGNSRSILVDTRAVSDITAQVQTAVSNVSMSNGIFNLDLALRNQSSQTYVPIVVFRIVGIQSASGTVRVINADNGGNGVETHAGYDYSRTLGPDDAFTPAETTGVRTLRFHDQASELFTFDALITGYVQTGGGGTTGGGSAGAPSGGSTSTGGSDSLLSVATKLMRVSVNPLTKSVQVTLIDVLR